MKSFQNSHVFPVYNDRAFFEDAMGAIIEILIAQVVLQREILVDISKVKG